MKKKLPNPRRQIFLGDIHGCYEEFLSLIDKCHYNKDEDDLIILGDFLNKGPKSCEIIRFLVKGKHQCLLGNHEIGFMKGKIPSLETELKSHFSNDEYQVMMDWLKLLPAYIETEDYIAVHAGLIPGLHPRDSRPIDIAKIRTWDGIGDDLQNAINPPWYDFYTDEKIVIFGHWAAKGLVKGHNYIGLDSGCVYGRKLSAYILEEDKIVQVDAFKEYAHF